MITRLSSPAGTAARLGLDERVTMGRRDANRAGSRFVAAARGRCRAALPRGSGLAPSSLRAAKRHEETKEKAPATGAAKQEKKPAVARQKRRQGGKAPKKTAKTSGVQSRMTEHQERAAPDPPAVGVRSPPSWGGATACGARTPQRGKKRKGARMGAAKRTCPLRLFFSLWYKTVGGYDGGRERARQRGCSPAAVLAHKGQSGGFSRPTAQRAFLSSRQRRLERSPPGGDRL